MAVQHRSTRCPFLDQRNQFLRAKYYWSHRLPLFFPSLASRVVLVVLQVRIVVLSFGVSRRLVRRGLGTGRARNRPLLRAARPAPSAALTPEREKGTEGGREGGKRGASILIQTKREWLGRTSYGRHISRNSTAGSDTCTCTSCGECKPGAAQSVVAQGKNNTPLS